MILKHQDHFKTAVWHVILLAAIFIFFLAGFVVFAYWYVFGFSSPFKIKNNLPQTTNQKIYVYPKHTLKNVLKEKLFDLD